MNLNDLKSQVALGEDSRRQFKRDATNVDSVAAAAFANSEGGVIYLGVAAEMAAFANSEGGVIYLGVAAEMAAFANSEGGVIYLGVADDGELPNNLTVAKIPAGNSIIRNPILVSTIAKGLLPYRGLGSDIKRALDDWPEIEFVDDQTPQRRHPLRLIVQRRDQGEALAAGSREGLPARDAHLLQRLQAVDHEGGAEHQQPAHVTEQKTPSWITWSCRAAPQPPSGRSRSASG